MRYMHEQLVLSTMCPWQRHVRVLQGRPCFQGPMKQFQIPTNVQKSLIMPSTIGSLQYVSEYTTTFLEQSAEDF